MIEATAQQLAWSRGRDNIEPCDWRDAEQMVARWQLKREAMGLPPLNEVNYSWY